MDSIKNAEIVSHQEKRNSILPNIRTAIAMLLLIAPSMHVQSEDTSKAQQEIVV